MSPSISELKVLPSFCFAFKIPDDRAVTNTYNTYKVICCQPKSRFAGHLRSSEVVGKVHMFLPSIFCLQQLCLATDSSLEWSSSGACKPRLQLGFGPYSEESFFLQRATLPTKQPSEPWTSPPWQSATSRGLAALWENKGLSKLSTHLLVYTSGKTRCVYLIEKKVFPSFYWN